MGYVHKAFHLLYGISTEDIVSQSCNEGDGGSKTGGVKGDVMAHPSKTGGDRANVGILQNHGKEALSSYISIGGAYDQNPSFLFCNIRLTTLCYLNSRYDCMVICYLL